MSSILLISTLDIIISFILHIVNLIFSSSSSLPTSILCLILGPWPFPPQLTENANTYDLLVSKPRMSPEFFFPSHSTGTPGAVLQALASGVVPAPPRLCHAARPAALPHAFPPTPALHLQHNCVNTNQKTLTLGAQSHLSEVQPPWPRGEPPTQRPTKPGCESLRGAGSPRPSTTGAFPDAAEQKQTTPAIPQPIVVVFCKTKQSSKLGHIILCLKPYTNSLAIPQKLNIELLQPRNSTCKYRTMRNENVGHTKLCMQMPVAVSPSTAKRCQQPKCPSAREQISKAWSIQAIECYLVINRNEHWWSEEGAKRGHRGQSAQGRVATVGPFGVTGWLGWGLACRMGWKCPSSLGS